MPEFGRLRFEDQRDRLHLIQLQATPRTQMFWITGPVLNQGNEPACVGYAWKQFLQTTPRRTLVGPGGSVIYKEAQLVDEWPGENYDGTSVRAGAKVLTSRGHLTEYIWGFDITTLANYILTRGPVVLGTMWYSGMMQPDANGWVFPQGNIVGGHAYLACGYSHVRNAFRCLNSWGNGWGQKGKFWLHKDELSQLLTQGGEGCSAIEKRAA